MYFRQATETEIVESIMQLNKEGGINDVSRKFLNMCKNHVSYYLKELFNFCIDSLVFPNVFKIAQITPIHKKGSLRNISNYRPVSVLNNLSKVFENLLYNRLQSFCHASNFLAKNQFGFRKHRSTELAGLSLLDKVLSALEDIKYAIYVFLVYSACFDTLSLVQFCMIN